MTPPDIDTSVAHPARIYDYWLGGKDNFAADREAAEQALLAFPEIVAAVKANRAFLARLVRHMVRACGIRQFLDIGTGIPTANHTHEVAQAEDPSCRVVYVDNDPIVLAHARALLASSPEGAAAYLDADLRDTQAILGKAARTLDFSQPVAILLLMILHMIPDSDEPYRLVRSLMDAVPTGSHLAISHPPSDIRASAAAEARDRINQRMGGRQGTIRSHAQVVRFFDGMELLEPGVVQPQQWRPDTAPGSGDLPLWCGVARKSASPGVHALDRTSPAR